MDANYVARFAADFATDREASDEVIKLIRKLRWIGKEEEARTMERELCQMPPAARGSVLAEPIATD